MSDEQEPSPEVISNAADRVTELLRDMGFKCVGGMLVLNEVMLRFAAHLIQTGYLDIGEMYKDADKITAKAREMIVDRSKPSGGVQ